MARIEGVSSPGGSDRQARIQVRAQGDQEADRPRSADWQRTEPIEIWAHQPKMMRVWAGSTKQPQGKDAMSGQEPGRAEGRADDRV